MSIALDISRSRQALRTGDKHLCWPLGEAPALNDLGMRLCFARNETIFSEGDEADYSYKVLSGVIRLCKHMADGRRQIADFVLAGDFCGLVSLDEHRFTAEAVSDVVVLAYPRHQVSSLGEKSPEMRNWMMASLTQSLVGMQDHLVMLGRQTAKERVVSFLLMLAHRAGADEGTVIELPMTRQDVADYLGLTIETVCRVLSELRRASIIELPSLNRVVLNDLDVLQDLADGE